MQADASNIRQTKTDEKGSDSTMKITVNIQTKKTELKRAVIFYHRSNSASIEYESGFKDSINSIAGADVVTFLEEVLREIILQLVARNESEPADIIVTGTELTKGAEAFIADKFTSDPLINSVTFA